MATPNETILAPTCDGRAAPCFRLGESVSEHETRHTEYKEVKGKNPIDAIKNAADEYTVAFLNSDGGCIYWGVRDDNLQVVGVPLDWRSADRLRKEVGNKIDAIQPRLDPTRFCIELHPVYNADAPVPDLWIVELSVDAVTSDLPYCTEGGEIFARVDGRKKRLSGTALYDWIRRRNSNNSQDNGVPTAAPRPSSFHGRRDEIAQLLGALTDDAITLVAIEGIGGIGKTALLSHFSGLVSTYGFVPVWIDCQDVLSFDAVCWQLRQVAIASEHGRLVSLLDEGGPQRAGNIATVLQEHRYVLFLDDYHVIADTVTHRFVNRLVALGGHSKVVVAIRQRIAALQELDPIRTMELRMRNGLDEESCAGFLRACRIELTPNTLASVWRLCGQGHPKALHLFAGRAKTVPINRLIASLPVFQESVSEQWLRPLLAELPADLRSVLIVWSIFDHAVPLSALSCDFGDVKTGAIALQLVDRFLIDYVREDAAYIHPLIRDFCHTLISDPKRAHQWAARQYIAQCGDIGAPEELSDAQVEDLTAAWSHRVRAGDDSAAVNIVELLRVPLIQRGQLSQLLYILNHTSPQSQASQRWFALHKARILSIRGDFFQAHQLLQGLLSYEDRTVAREAVLVLADAHNLQRLPTNTLSLIKQNLKLFSGTSPRVRSRLLKRVVDAHVLLGQWEDAYESAATVHLSCEQRGDEISAAVSLRQMAHIRRLQGDGATAFAHAERSYGEFTKHGRLHDAALSKLECALALEVLSRHEEALSRFDEALKVFTLCGDVQHSAICREYLAPPRWSGQASWRHLRQMER